MTLAGMGPGKKHTERDCKNTPMQNSTANLEKQKRELKVKKKQKK